MREPIAAFARRLRQPLAAVVGNAVAGIRLALGHRTDANAFTISSGHALLALALGLSIIAAVARVSAGADASFWIWGFVASAAELQLWLAVLALSAWLCARPTGLSTLVVVLAFAELPMWALLRALEYVANQLVPDIDTPYTAIYYGSALAWYAVVFWRALTLLPTPALWRRLLAVLAYACTLTAIHEWLPSAAIFYQEEQSLPEINIETVYYEQAGLVEAALARLRPQTPSHSDLYFIGMATYAEQDVFKHEVEQARAIVEQRLGLAGRTITLINHPQTVATVALANRHNLAEVAEGLARIIDRDDDIVVLFLTSHGYRDASIAVELGALGLNDIHASDIRAIFDAAGIRWRVIIVSACYSGGFIDELKSPDTIVITASARDRSSFGCSHENTWTYFGRAYFAEALMQTADLVAAFDVAKRSIAARERRELKKASKPQIWIGPALAAHLKDGRAPASSNQPSDSR